MRAGTSSIAKDPLLELEDLSKSNTSAVQGLYDQINELYQAFEAFHGDVAEQFDNPDYGFKAMAYVTTLRALLEIKRLQLAGESVDAAGLVLAAAMNDAEKEIIKVIHDIA